METSQIPAPLRAQIFITRELSDRPERGKDWSRAKSAVQELAVQISADPDHVLPRFVELAMEMTAGSSAGLSLFEDDAPPPGVFRWHHLIGTLAPFNGGTTPRNYSPCGVTLDDAAPVLVEHPERAYQWLVDANVVLPEVLLVPLFLGGPEPLGTLWIVSETGNHFDSGDARLATELAGFVGMALRMRRNRQRLRAAMRAQDVRARDTNQYLSAAVRPS